MRARSISKILLGAALVALLPVATDGGQAECCNVTGSLASTAAGPVNGDEAFFKLPTGPANVMLLLDVSGSMDDLPQCPSGWGSSPCVNPTLPAPPNSTDRAVTFTYTGTCEPWNNTSPSGASSPLYWLSRVTPKTEYADPGRSNTLLTDRSPWGNGCTGNACLFDPKAVYLYGDWTAGSSAASTYATRRGHEDGADGLPVTCTALDGSGNPIRDYNGNPIVLGSDCTTCLENRGFFFYRLSRYTSLSWSGVPNAWRQYTPGGSYRSPPLWKGTFLNANPPKWVTARKVVKDVAWMDPSAPRKLDNVRLGLAILDSGASAPRRARLIVPLGPDKTGAYPPSQQNFRQARQYILSVMNYDTTVYADAATIVDGSTLTGFFNPATTYTPLASALFNVGQYFSSQNRYNTLLGSGYQTSVFNESSAGEVNAAWARSNPNQCSICWGCQNNSVVMVTDGMPNSEITFPSAIRNYDAAGYTAAANCGTSGTLCDAAILPRVADWLHNQDLRADAVMSGAQKVTVHTVAFGLNDATALRVLQATANLGGGIFQNASDPEALGEAVYNAINQVIPKEDSYTAANTNSLLTVRTQAAEAFISRFKPNQSPTWEGHVYQTFLFDEVLQGCDATKAVQPTVTCGTRTVSADYDGDGTCNGLFTVDLDCDEISEDAATGAFVKKGQNLPANLPWDAGLVLSDPTKTGYRSANEDAANARDIFTYINGARVAFKAANAATLLPYLNISSPWCSSFLTQLGITPAVGQERLTCAQQLIHFVRGWDTLNQDSDSCWGPGNPRNVAGCPSGTSGEERNRVNDGSSAPIFWKLGDIFHSASAVVQVPSDEIRCDTGHDKQCVATLHSPTLLPNQTPIDKYAGTGSLEVDAYERYRLDQIAARRKRVLLVGANDGMLHAFDAGEPDISAGRDVTGSYPYTQGTGGELWAFIPPDLLPRLKELTVAHQYMVDAPVMVRDVWVDTHHDGAKQRDEYHTVAVFGRRSGGTAYSALDVTDPTSPTLRWSFPLDCSDDARWMGQSWTELGSKPPPIVPVRLSTGGSGSEERWVVMINGGYDPMLVKGRAVFMLDAWTGATLWRWTDDDFKSTHGYGSGTSMFPVTAGIAMMDIGDPTYSRLDQDGMFDTATWGDLGGNLWIARFKQPGVVDPATGRVANWFAARAFEQQRRDDDAQSIVGRNEFYEIASAGWHAPTHSLRVMLGSGNREQLMTTIPTCGTDNLLGCCQAGCTSLSATTATNYGACNSTTTFSCSNDLMSYSTTSTASCSGTAQCAAAPGNAYTVNLNVSAACPGYGAGSVSGSAFFDANGLGTVAAMPTLSARDAAFRALSHNRFYGVWAYGGAPGRTFESATTAAAFDRNRLTDRPYASVCAGPTGNACSLVETTYANVSLDAVSGTELNISCAAGTKCSANAQDPGWFYEYGRNCPLDECPASASPPWADEKTSGSALITGSGCVLWNSFRPVGSTTSTDPCSGSLGVPAAYGYQVDAVSGSANPLACGTLLSPTSGGGSSGGGAPSPYGEPGVRQPIARASPTHTGSTSPDSFVTVTCSEGGGVGSGTVTWSGSRVTKTPPKTKPCAAEMIYSLEVDRDVHACRHVDAATCE